MNEKRATARTIEKPGTRAAADEKLAPIHRKYLSDFGLEDIDPDGLTIRNYKKGELLCEQGSPLDEMLIITGGRVKVFSMAANGKTLLFCYSDPGATLGEVELMTHAFASSSAYFGDIRTLIPETSGQHIGIIRTAYRKHPDTLPG